MFLEIENYTKEGKKIEVKNVILDFPLIYAILKKYLKGNNDE